jgi:uncharacterized protein YjlB
MTSIIRVRYPAVPQERRFRDDMLIPNSKHPVLWYRHAIDIAENIPADFVRGAFEEWVGRNHWYVDWMNGVYSFTHYHSTAHETLVVIGGTATLELGGPFYGKDYAVRQGDVLVIPAGVAHRGVRFDQEFKILGIYLQGTRFDIIRGEKQMKKRRHQAIANIKKLPVPLFDPIYGAEGPLPRLWK